MSSSGQRASHVDPANSQRHIELSLHPSSSVFVLEMSPKSNRRSAKDIALSVRFLIHFVPHSRTNPAKVENRSLSIRPFRFESIVVALRVFEDFFKLFKWFCCLLFQDADEI